MVCACGWASLQHGGSGIVGLLTQWLGVSGLCVAENKLEAVVPFMTQVWKSYVILPAVHFIG